MATEVGNVCDILLKFKWEIKDFCMRCKKVGDFLESPKFTAKSKDIQWHLRLYPKGVNATTESYFIFYLFANENVQSSLDFNIFNYEGAKIRELTPVGKARFANIAFKNNASHKIFPKNAKYIHKEFALHEDDGILKDDVIRIACEINLPQCDNVTENSKTISQEVQKQEDVELPHLEDEYEVLLMDNKFRDVTLISEGKSLKVHKCILAKRSTVFAATFDADLNENQENIVEIADVKYDVLLEMLRFVYVGKINNIDKLVSELVIAADKYGLDDLKSVCEKTMIKNLDLDNVIDCLQLVDKLRLDKLKEKAIEFIVENAIDAGDKPEFNSLPRDIMCEVFRSLVKVNK